MKTIARPFMFFKSDIQRIMRYLNVRMSEVIPPEGADGGLAEEWVKLTALWNRLDRELNGQWPKKECKTLHGIALPKELLNDPAFGITITPFPCRIMKYKPLELPRVKQVAFDELQPNDVVHIPLQKGVSAAIVGKVTGVKFFHGDRWTRTSVQVTWEGVNGTVGNSLTLYEYQWNVVRVYKEAK